MTASRHEGRAGRRARCARRAVKQLAGRADGYRLDGENPHYINLLPPRGARRLRGRVRRGGRATAQRHEVLVLTSTEGHAELQPESHVRRELSLLSPDAARGAARAGGGSLRAVTSARARARVGAGSDLRLERVFDSSGGVARARRQRRAALRSASASTGSEVCSLAISSCASCCPQREALREPPGLRGCRAFNRLPALRLDPVRPLHAAISWNSEAIERMVPTPRLHRVGARACRALGSALRRPLRGGRA